ncbi:hypothetical protein FNH13_08330 [Ornithinimicrobium ciconiae]|uniref:Uncharacterized protein n=1 Tax=Ornithinimicrobium ciconiae TaxID=2594265 RepID=A0A516GA01_9MICO|nr:hypothetical protein [Ornithinimicrobium ciconiae]QDO88348.1 hypothetical protein FNH13_08330 [Ornithinimicrobium ciconiae]
MTDKITEQNPEVETDEEIVEIPLDTEQTDPPEDEQTPEVEVDEDDPETFPREYVVKLRKESATYRDKAKKAEDYARELHAARVAATGRLADPSDLDFDEGHLDDLGRLNAAIDDLLNRKPHLASRTPRGDVGQGMSGATDTVDLAGILRSRA